MTVSIISAISTGNRALGFQGDLIYKISDDLKRFKKLTSGHTVIMGRKTFDSLPGGALPNRRNIVISRNASEIPGAEVYNHIEDALKAYDSDDEVFIIGGASIYKQVVEMGITDKFYMTEVYDTPANADCFFPEIPQEYDVKWAEVHTTPDGLKYAFVDYERI